MNNYTQAPGPESSPSPSAAALFGGIGIAIGLLIAAIWIIEKMGGKK